MCFNPCKSRKLVEELCLMTDLRCTTTLPARNFFLNKCLVQLMENGEKGQWSFHSVTWQSISCDAWQAAAQNKHSMGGLVPHYRARKKWGCIGRKQESMFKSGEWRYISCNLWWTNFVFHVIIYPAGGAGSDGTTRVQVKARFFFFFLVLQSGKLMTDPHPCVTVRAQVVWLALHDCWRCCCCSKFMPVPQN